MTGSSHSHHLNLKGLLLFSLGFVVVLLYGPVLVSSGLRNASLVVLVKQSYCNQGDLTCHPYPSKVGNQILAERAKRWLETALKWQPNSPTIRLHLAEVYFGLGLRHQAADMAAPLASYPPGRSPLVAVGVSRERYEYYLVNAEQMAAEGNWTEAIKDFRLGFAGGGEQILPIDLQNFYESQAKFYQNQALTTPTAARMYYLTGKYLLQSGKSPAALPWLEQATSKTGTGRLTPDDAGRAQIIMGQILEMHGDLTGARKAYDQAITDSPNLREAYVYLIHLLQAEGEPSYADRIRVQLATLGPGTILGRQANNYRVLDPVTLPDGWTFVGYDLDEESLESGGQIEMLLWWQKPGDAIMEGKAWTQAGPYWLEWHTVTNLFPNAGFEWGTRKDGIPLGLNREFYGAAAESLEVKSVFRDDLNTLALFADNDAQNPNIAVVSFPSQVDPSEYYLMAGWLWDEGRTANIGRNCLWKGGGAPYYIAYEDQEPHRPLSTWVHIADLNVALPGKQIENSCEVLLINHGVQTKAAWDDILWVPISSP